MTNSTARPPIIPFVFVLSEVPAPQLEAFRSLEPENAWPYLTRGVSIWCLQTFLELRERGWPVALMSEPQPGCVNFVHVRELFRQRPAPDIFIVSIQADYTAVPWTSTNIVQNRLQADQKRSYWIPHWPQPGLIPRSPSRSGVATVAYAGDPLWLVGSEIEWTTALKSHGIDFCCLKADAWNDYSAVDVLLAVRSFDKSRYEYKPPSKLLNAWHARIPLVGGYDSAFEQIGRPGCDYIRVCTLNQAIETIRLLRDNQVLYRSIVDAGSARALEYTRHRIADAWEKLLSGPISARYARWRKDRFVSGLRERIRFRAWRVGRLLRLGRRPS
jgi:hypothetical protein